MAVGAWRSTTNAAHGAHGVAAGAGARGTASGMFGGSWAARAGHMSPTGPSGPLWGTWGDWTTAETGHGAAGPAGTGFGGGPGFGTPSAFCGAACAGHGFPAQPPGGADAGAGKGATAPALGAGGVQPPATYGRGGEHPALDAWHELWPALDHATNPYVNGAGDAGLVHAVAAGMVAARHPPGGAAHARRRGGASAGGTRERNGWSTRVGGGNCDRRTSTGGAAPTRAAPSGAEQWRRSAGTARTLASGDICRPGGLPLRARDLQDTMEVAAVVLPPGPEGQTTSDHTTMVGDSAILAAMRKRMAENSNSEEDIKALREGPGLAGAGGCRRTYQLPGHEEPVEEPRPSQRLEFPNSLGNIDISHFDWLS